MMYAGVTTILGIGRIKMNKKLDRKALDRVIAVINGKGGVGKTALTSHVAGLLALGGTDVLVVDMDPGAGLATDLGYQGSDIDDEGFSLRVALETGHQAKITQGVRENLDVIMGGQELFEASHFLAAQAGKRQDPRLALARVLAPIAGDYDVILIDSPPGDDTLQNAVLGAARWTIIPTKGDLAGANGVKGVERRLAAIIDVNPGIDILGATLFDVDMQAQSRRLKGRAGIGEVVGEESDTFNTIVRHVITPAQEARAQGLLVHELRPQSRSSRALAMDYQALTQEIVERLEQKEQGEQA